MVEFLPDTVEDRLDSSYPIRKKVEVDPVEERISVVRPSIQVHRVDDSRSISEVIVECLCRSIESLSNDCQDEEMRLDDYVGGKE